MHAHTCMHTCARTHTTGNDNERINEALATPTGVAAVRRTLDLSDNGLNGTVPSRIGALSALEYVAKT